jgi:YfiH family protein
VDSFFELGFDGIYRCAAFAQFEWQEHGFGTRHGQPETDVTLRQIHSNVVWNAGGLKDREQEGDALVTGEAGLRIGVRTADCVPILLLDAELRMVGAAHAGWRGSAAEVVTATMGKMASDPANVWAAIGPCIRECCYEVSEDVSARFDAWTSSEVSPNEKRNLNLAAANIRQLELAGVPGAQIFDCGLCTFCRIETFYSFRREPEEPGRLVSAIARRSFSCRVSEHVRVLSVRRFI